MNNTTTAQTTYQTALIHSAQQMRVNSDKNAPCTLLNETVYALELIERIQREAVTLARAQGNSWETIAASLGITRQAAQKRYDR